MMKFQTLYQSLKNKYPFLFFYFIIFFPCIPVLGGQLENCDLIFQISEDSDFSKAITETTAIDDSIKLSHVGIIWIDNDTPKVIEASPEEGVRIMNLEEFTLSCHNGFIIKRLSIEIPKDRIIERALSYVGQPYDWWYYPDNDKMYCSELIYESFLSSEGNNIFQGQPMNFRDSNGAIPDFWIQLFSELNQKVPEGVIGTNPNDLFKDPRLIEVLF